MLSLLKILSFSQETALGPHIVGAESLAYSNLKCCILYIKTHIEEGALYVMSESRKSTKKVAEKGKILQKTEKEECAVNWKMPFWSHGNLKNLTISAETGKLF